MNYTLITGASKGIGKAIAVEAAHRRMNLLLVARSKELLEHLAAELSNQDVSIKILATDLLADDAHKKIFAFVKEQGLQVNMLINNAGMGGYGKFGNMDLQKQLDMMKLNIDSCVKIAHEFLNTTDTSQRRYILNTVSTGAFQPVPMMTIYAATKAFMLSFSRGLRHELKKENVYVTALCPGGTETEFFKPAGMEEVVRKNAQFMMSADKVAKAGLNGLMKNKSVVVPGFTNKMGALSAKLMPHDIVVPVAATFFKE
jgi:short-subunit dehydrogenase